MLAILISEDLELATVRENIVVFVFLGLGYLSIMLSRPTHLPANFMNSFFFTVKYYFVEYL